MQWSIVIFQSFHMAISCEKPNCHLGCAIQEASKKNTYMIYIYIYDLYIGVSIVIELPNSWMKKIVDNSNLKWMINRGTPTT